MKILVVEDAEERIKWFQKRFTTDNVIVVDNVDNAIDVLKNAQDFDCIFLDHDLGDQPGTIVAKFLRDLEFEGQVIVHSMNSSGAMNIKAILPDAMILSFSELVRLSTE